MNDFSLIMAAVAAASSFGFLAALSLTILLLLVCAGLYAQTRALKRQVGVEKNSKNAMNYVVSALSTEKARLTFANAALRGQVGDLRLQRRDLEFALFDAMDEIDALGSDLRSTNRQLKAAFLRNSRITGERDDARETLRRTERSLRWALEGNRRRESTPAQIPLSLVSTRPAPYGLIVWAGGSRAEVRWSRCATDNTGVEYCLNDGPWKSLPRDTTSLSFIVPKGTTYYVRVRNTWSAGTPHSPSSSCTICVPKAA